MGFRDLLAFLTAIPVGGGSLEGAARSYPLAPLVGLIVGVAAWAAGAVAAELSGPTLAGAVYTAAHVALTGALHLDGFSDFADVIHSGARGEEARRILRDPRRGSGAIAYTGALLLVQYAAAGEVYAARGPLGSAAPLIASHVLAYQAMYIASALLPPPPYMGLGRLFRDLGASAPGSHAANAAALAAALAAPAALGWAGAGWAVEAAAWLAGLWASARLARSRLGYASGDVLGFTHEATRAAALLGAALAG